MISVMNSTLWLPYVCVSNSANQVAPIQPTFNPKYPVAPHVSIPVVLSH